MEPNKNTPSPMSRPSARMAAAPIQRGNYGIPSRQTVMPPVTPTPAAPQPPATMAVPTAAPVPTPKPSVPTGRFMDFAPPRPTSPQPVAPVAAQPVMSAPQSIQQTAPASAPLSSPVKPLFTPAPAVAKPVKVSRLNGKTWQLFKVGLLVFGSLLLLAGIGRWATAGSTKGENISVGAVAANDGKTMTIQFTADDGKIHKFKDKSQETMIPGTATQVAYRSGAPEASAKQVSTVDNAHKLGVSLFLAALVVFGGFGLTAVVRTLVRKRQASAAPLTTSVTV